MNAQNYNVVGIMSGTSLDGIDLAYINFDYTHHWTFKIMASQCVPYSTEWKNRLAHGINMNVDQLSQLDQDYTKYLAGVIKDFIKLNEIKDLIAVCSHGHTISHDPANGHTLQIGNLPILAQLIKQRLVCDFRIQDVQLGGQGAPLVPIGDHLLFHDFDRCLNLGGFANLSYQLDNSRVAFDICPLNVVLNHYASHLNHEYDKGGAFAKAGAPQTAVISQLDQLSYYQQPAPKSLGIEWVNKHVFPLLTAIKDPKDALATFTHHAAGIIARNLPVHSNVLATGGGAYNNYLLQLISEKRGRPVMIPESRVIDFKEAVIFGLLGVLRLRNQINCLSSVTGAQKDHSSGKIYIP